MKQGIALFKREALRIVADSGLRLIVVAAPLFYALFYGTVYFYKTPARNHVAVVNADGSLLSYQFIRQITAHPALQVTETPPSVADALALLQHGRVCGVVYIPERFERSIRLRRPVTVKVYQDNTRFLVSNEINRALNDIKTEYDTRHAPNSAFAGGSGATVQPLLLEQRTLGNTAETYGGFLLPGLFLLILAQTLLIGMAESIGRERGEATLLLAFPAGCSVGVGLAAKAAPYLLIYSVYAAFIAGCMLPLFGIYPAAGLPLFTLAVVAGIAAQVSFGLFAGSFFKSKLTALLVLAFSSYPVFLISGYPFPAHAMPLAIRLPAYLMPGTALLAHTDLLLLTGATARDFTPYFIHTAMLCILYAVGSVYRYRRLTAAAQSTKVP